MSEDKWIPAVAVSELDQGAMIGVTDEDKQIAVYNVDGEFYATDNICSHALALLTDGYLDGDVVECPLHGGCFKVKTGEGMGAPISEDIKTYAVRVSDGIIEVKFS